VYAHDRNCRACHVPGGTSVTLEASLPRMTARSSPTKITWTVETDVFDQTARVAKEIADGAAPSLPSDPGQRANAARDFKPDINT
jgi:hypothetical protein